MPAYIKLPNGSFVRKRFITGASARRYAAHKVSPPWGVQMHDEDPWGKPWGNLIALRRFRSEAYR